MDGEERGGYKEGSGVLRGQWEDGDGRKEEGKVIRKEGEWKRLVEERRW